jgi:predicted aspartyl protease
MSQVHVQVILTNYREAVLARLGQLDASQVHRYETEALIDTGATHSVLPPAVAERLGLIRLDHIEAQYTNGTFEEVDLLEVFTIELLGRRADADELDSWLMTQNPMHDVLVEVVVSKKSRPTHDASGTSAAFSARRRLTTGLDWFSASARNFSQSASCCFRYACTSSRYAR